MAFVLTPSSPPRTVTVTLSRALYTWMSATESVAMCCCVTCRQGTRERDVHLSLNQTFTEPVEYFITAFVF